MTNKDLFYFTGKCLMIDEHPGFREEIIRDIESDSCDWQKFVSLCSSHLILPLIYLKFRSQDILDHVPDELSEFLKEVYQLNLSRNEEILRQLHDLTAVLNKNGIYPTYLKGAGNLLDNLYSDPGERIIGDIDFLVSEKDFLPAANILESAGYHHPRNYYTDPGNAKHYPPLYKKNDPAHLEIHRMPVNSGYIKWFNTGLIDREKKALNNKTSVFVLSDNHKAIHNFIHSQLIHKGHLYGVVSFRDLYDLYLISRRINVSQTISQIKQKRKAIAYFVFAGKALGAENMFYPTSNFSSRLFSMKHRLNLSSPIFYQAYRIPIYIVQRIIIGFTGQLVQSFYSKGMRRSIINRLTDKQWYKDHLASYKSFFSPTNSRF
jgi:hypothetical protein